MTERSFSMKYYISYFDSQAISGQAHARLLELPEQRPARRAVLPAAPLTALALCAALAVLVGTGGFLASRRSTLPSQTPLPVPPSATQAPDASALPGIPPLPFEDLTGEPQLDASIVLPDGAFRVPLEEPDIFHLLRAGEDGLAPLLAPLQEYTITGEALYDGQGGLWQLTIRGDRGESSFTLAASPGRIPPTCLVDPDVSTSRLNGVPVYSTFRSMDIDGVKEYTCSSQFMAGDVGIRFTNTGAAFSSGYNGNIDRALGGAQLLNAMFVRQMLCEEGGGLNLDRLLRNDEIPVWEELELETYANALAQDRFSPYLPEREPNFGNEFHGRMSYQEGVRDTLWVRWTTGYDNVEISIHLPEGEEDGLSAPVDIQVPESYDWRLYDIPICDNVPEEYQMEFYKPVFRAEDMSLETVKARQVAHDTGGFSYRFYVLHENGVRVGYECSGVSAQFVWELVSSSPASAPAASG